jgi:hypothetical protein
VAYIAKLGGKIATSVLAEKAFSASAAELSDHRRRRCADRLRNKEDRSD